MKVKGFLLLILICISSIIVFTIYLFNMNGIYQEYSKDMFTTSAIEAVLSAAGDDVYPWSEVQSADDSDAFDYRKTIRDAKSSAEDLKYVTPKSFVTVDDSYFDDALFIGDSRMVGLSQYCEPIDSRATFYAKKSLSIYDIRDEQWIETDDGRDISLEEALTGQHFSKVYIMVGINELGRGDVEEFKYAYQTVIDNILNSQPQATIFINSIMHVSVDKNDTDPLYNNTNINLRNEALETLADGQQIFYIDINEAVDDDQGNLNSETTTDGVHLKGAYYELWYQYLLTHGIE
ncbi:MAG: hypothetical protein K6F66_10345 [Pseudobutyrivibrio sp.]|nr:hypothetical protein [Pseudobutyrivibrio sp.]